MKKNIKSMCIANDCSATFPNVNELVLSDLPVNVQKKVQESYEKAFIKRCVYCGTVWLNYFNDKYKCNCNRVIGTRNLGSDITIWKI